MTVPVAESRSRHLPAMPTAGPSDGRPARSGTGDIFQLLRDGKQRTRAELIAMTGLARSTMAGRIDLLLETGLISPAGEATSTGGRPPATFAFNPSSRVVLAVDLGATHARVAITDLASNILASVDAPLLIAQGPAVVLEWVATQGERLMAEVGRGIGDLISVGIGLPGPVEHATGRPINPPIMPGWDDADVPGILSERFRSAVLVDNDVNIMALGEHRTEWPDVSDLLFVKLATGIGAGIIADGQLRRGAQGAAGDIGHVAVPDGGEIPCRCGNFGCLEAVASGRAIAEMLAAAGIAAQSGSDVAALVRAGDIPASQAVRQAGRRIGLVLATCVSLLNPSVIVIGGAMAKAGEHLLAGIREAVYQRSLPLASQHLRIVGSLAGERAGVLGASVMAIDHVLSADAVDALVG